VLNFSLIFNYSERQERRRTKNCHLPAQADSDYLSKYDIQISMKLLQFKTSREMCFPESEFCEMADMPIIL